MCEGGGGTPTPLLFLGGSRDLFVISQLIGSLHLFELELGSLCLFQMMDYYKELKKEDQHRRKLLRGE